MRIALTYKAIENRAFCLKKKKVISIDQKGTDDVQIWEELCPVNKDFGSSESPLERHEKTTAHNEL